LDRLVIMLGEMLQYKNFHDDPTKPPFPWDPEAARWCRAYRKTHPHAFPVDHRELMRPERVKLTSSVPVTARTARVKVLTTSPGVKPPSRTGRNPGRHPVAPKGISASVKPGVKIRIKSSSR
jgi:hypothetical protein